MRRLFVVIIWIFLASCVGFVDIFFRISGLSSLYMPFFLVSFWSAFLVHKDDASAILKMLPSFFIVDLYSPTPFGVLSFALWCGFYLMHVFFKKIFNTVSILPLMTTTFVCLFIVRSLEVVVIMVLSIFQKKTVPFGFEYSVGMLQEALATAFFAGIFFAVFKLFIRKRVRLHTTKYISL